jgi:hypothetical protein
MTPHTVSLLLATGAAENITAATEVEAARSIAYLCIARGIG